MKLLTAESVCIGHPDKLCDFIADSVLDACLKEDKKSRVACEVMAANTLIVVGGEITTIAKIDILEITKEALKKVGYNPDEFEYKVCVHTQSPDIASGVDKALETRNGEMEDVLSLGAGDQGTVYGYATNETKEYLPLPLVLSHKICKCLDDARVNGVINEIFPDGKAQVTIEYDGDKPKRVKTIVVSIQHSESVDLDTLKKEIIQKVLSKAFITFPYDKQTEILINPSGRFVEGGPKADTGLTGRKIMVDTYGGLALHGGGAFSGKDYTKVDRSGAYIARSVAKNIVKANLADRCLVSISYAIGKAKPVALFIDTFNTNKVNEGKIANAVRSIFNLCPKSIIETLDLTNVTYTSTSTYGHFGKEDLSWETLDKTEELKKAVL